MAGREEGAPGWREEKALPRWSGHGERPKFGPEGAWGPRGPRVGGKGRLAAVVRRQVSGTQQAAGT